MAKTKVVICPYCGETQTAGERCRSCGGLFEPLSRQATLNEMGPWFVRNPRRMFQPGCSYETLVKLVDRGLVTKYSIVRGPTTRQFWTVARHVPGIAHLLGYCHNCDASVDPGDHGCHACGVPFGAYLDRNYLGLPEVRPLPWEADASDEMHELGRKADRVRWLEHARPTPTGISSFASDAEILVASPAAPARGATPATSGNGGPQAVEVRPASVPDAADSGRMADALVRRLKHQLRFQRRLVTLLFALLIVSGTIGLFAIARIVSLERTAAPTDPAAPAEIGGLAPAERESPATASESDAAVEKLAEGGLAGGEDITALPEFEEAAELLRKGGLADRPLEERIADYETALDLLGKLTEGASQPPSDVTAMIEKARRELDALKLRQYFP